MDDSASKFPTRRPTGDGDRLLEILTNSVQWFGHSVTTGTDEAIVRDDAIFARTAEDLVAASAAIEVIVPAVIVEYIVFQHSVNDVITVLGMNQIIAADVVRSFGPDRIIK
jgi:hypothetical protein